MITIMTLMIPSQMMKMKVMKGRVTTYKAEKNTNLREAMKKYRAKSEHSRSISYRMKSKVSFRCNCAE